ncbi:uncharacterized protein N0V89_003440 [Didymosphaeria variabile]|uniref:Uncharacterized protein n=1 Tax=Didymosphaeria variabile TaxID=1932322 RepID=A0A9W8XNE1_9PLEO|nr:uncharacterized protein N0V89_003440 [Didymosphaeria variabile]KAJ4355424.1 hypothetical protein N0V89_003440 [Didymosphaeria variabile]
MLLALLSIFIFSSAAPTHKDDNGRVLVRTDAANNTQGLNTTDVTLYKIFKSEETSAIQFKPSVDTTPGPGKTALCSWTNFRGDCLWVDANVGCVALYMYGGLTGLPTVRSIRPDVGYTCAIYSDFGCRRTNLLAFANHQGIVDLKTITGRPESARCFWA